MEQPNSGAMGSTRALITEKEREQISGEHGDQRKYEAVSRVRRRVREQLTEDVSVLEEEHPELLEEIQEVICDD